MTGGSLFDNSGTTVRVNIGNNTWTTLGTTLKTNMDHLSDAMRYAVEGIWSVDDDIVERNDIMDILKLYLKRKREEIELKYNELIDKDYAKLEVVNEYKKLVNDFEINLAQLADKYNTKEESFIVRSGYEADYTFELNDELRENIGKNYAKLREADLKALYDFEEEVRAVLSVSDDKDYQLDVLKNYEILDKKGRLTI